MEANVSDWSASQGEKLIDDTLDENEMEFAAKNVERSYELLKKRSVITIKKLDRLCLARALVTMKELADGDPDKQYVNLRRGRPIQERLAKELHRELGVPEGPCGYHEVQKMQEHLFPHGYQIKVIDETRCALWYCDPKFESASKRLYLLKIGDHFHGVRSVPGLLKRGYCHDCEQGFNQTKKHNCTRDNCGKCRRFKGRCVDFKGKKSAFVFCEVCCQSFYGLNCFAFHKTKSCKKIKKLTRMFSFV